MKSKIKEALAFAMEKHSDQFRRGSNLPYIVHPISVYATVKKFKDSKSIEEICLAAILHDTVEDCGVTVEELQEKFGDMTAGLVEELTNNDYEIDRIGKEEYINKKLVKLTSYALVIKLADMLDNLSDSPTEKMIIRINNNINYLIENRKVISNTHNNLIDQIQKVIEEFSITAES